MTKKIVIHSFRGGTGKSTITANVASHLAMAGNKVLVIDTDLRSPGIHAFFGLHEESFSSTLNDYLLGEAKITDAAYDVSKILGLKQGNLLIVPSCIEYGEIANTLISKYSFDLLSKAYDKLIEEFDLDYLIIDTHPGINEEMLLSAEMADSLLIVFRPDNQDYQGVKVSTEIAHKLGLNAFLVLNKVHPKQDVQKTMKMVKDLFGFPVIAAIPFSEDVALSESKHVMVKQQPKSEFAKKIKQLVGDLTIRSPGSMLNKK